MVIQPHQRLEHPQRVVAVTEGECHRDGGLEIGLLLVEPRQRLLHGIGVRVRGAGIGAQHPGGRDPCEGVVVQEAGGGPLLAIGEALRELDGVVTDQVVLPPFSGAYVLDHVGACELAQHGSGTVHVDVQEAPGGVQAEVRPGIDRQETEQAGLFVTQPPIGQLERGAYRPLAVVQQVELAVCLGQVPGEFGR